MDSAAQVCCVHNRQREMSVLQYVCGFSKIDAYKNCIIQNHFQVKIFFSIEVISLVTGTICLYYYFCLHVYLCLSQWKLPTQALQSNLQERQLIHKVLGNFICLETLQQHTVILIPWFPPTWRICSSSPPTPPQ